MTIDEEIKNAEELAELNEDQAQIYKEQGDTMGSLSYRECANEHRQLAEWLKELKRDREILDGLSIYFQSLVVDAVINQRPLMFDMRDATKEERESVNQYIADSAETTGVNFWSIIGEVNADEDKGVLEKINEKQNSLWATCKAWEDEAISRDGYVKLGGE